MARGPPRRQSSSVAHSPKETHELPVAVFSKAEDSNIPTGVHDNQMKAYGFNDLTQYERPDHYVRYIEPLDIDLARQVEYDMDEQDEEWLITINAERKEQQINTVSREVFEIIVDRLEKEYYELRKHVPRNDFAVPSEESFCAICDDPEPENMNLIIFCDGCNLAVHQECYGVQYVPEGQWFCRKCEIVPEHPVECALCPNEGGAFKPTTTGGWVHSLCAWWTPEVTSESPKKREPVILSNIDPRRLKLKCTVCGISNKGSCVQCRRGQCPTAYHVTCARKWKLLMPMKGTTGLVHYCPSHLPEENKEAHREARLQAEQSIVAADSKVARAYAKTYKASPPLVPWIIADRITQYISRINVRKKQEFVIQVCKYWTLKREHRRGAPLLKRLHVEAWSSSTDDQSVTTAAKKRKLEMLEDMRHDLEAARSIAELIRKRESRKLKQTLRVKHILTSAIFPHEAALRSAFEKISAMDRSGHFQNPVSRIQVPDYFDVIKNPMCWKTVQEKLDKHEYWDVESFKADVNLVWVNAKRYNAPDTGFYRTAAKIEEKVPAIFQELEKLKWMHDHPVSDSGAASVVPSNGRTADFAPVGNLEPHFDVLNMLYDPQSVQDGVDSLIHVNPITSLFSYEEETPKPPPPPPPTPPPVLPPISKHDKKAQSKSLKKKSVKDKRPSNALPPLLILPAMQQEVNTASSSRLSSRRRTRSSSDDEQEHWAGQASVPKLADAEELTKKDNFQYFDAGWVLPEGSKRKRPSTAGLAMSPVQLPPPSKRRKLSSKKSASFSLRTPTVDRDVEYSSIPETPRSEGRLLSFAPPDTSLEAESGHHSQFSFSHVPDTSPGDENIAATAHSPVHVSPTLSPPPGAETDDLPPLSTPSAAIPHPSDKHKDVNAESPKDLDRSESLDIDGTDGVAKDLMGQETDEMASEASSLPVAGNGYSIVSITPAGLSSEAEDESSSASESDMEEQQSSVKTKGLLTPKDSEQSGRRLVAPQPAGPLAPASSSSRQPSPEEPVACEPPSPSHAAADEAPQRSRSPPIGHAVSASGQTADIMTEDSTYTSLVGYVSDDALEQEDDLGVQRTPDVETPSPSPMHSTSPTAAHENNHDKQLEMLTVDPIEPKPSSSSQKQSDLKAVPELAELSAQEELIHSTELEVPSEESLNDLQTLTDRQVEATGNVQAQVDAVSASGLADGEDDADAQSSEGEDPDDYTQEEAEARNPGKNVYRENGVWIIEEIVSPKTPKFKHKNKPLKEKLEDRLRNKSSFPEGHRIKPKTFVWAKSGSPLYYPGIIFEPNHPFVPLNLGPAPSRAEMNYHLVRFGFTPKQYMWAWVPLRSIQAFGMFPEVDDDMVALKSRQNKWKSKPNKRKEVLSRYAAAKAAKELEDKGMGESSGSGAPYEQDEVGDEGEAEVITHAEDDDDAKVILEPAPKSRRGRPPSKGKGKAPLLEEKPTEDGEIEQPLPAKKTRKRGAKDILAEEAEPEDPEPSTRKRRKSSTKAPLMSEAGPEVSRAGRRRKSTAK